MSHHLNLCFVGEFTCEAETRTSLGVESMGCMKANVLMIFGYEPNVLCHSMATS
jgi:hypothetical protein